MSCPLFRDLEEKFRIAESRWAQYAYPQKTPEGTSDARARTCSRIETTDELWGNLGSHIS